MVKTLVILGAGASKDFCPIFPMGLELIKEINYHFLTEKSVSKNPNDDSYLSALMNFIAKISKNDSELFNVIKNQLWKVQLDYEWYHMRNWPKMRPISIDNFISNAIKKGALNDKARDIIKCSIYYLIKGTEQAFAEGIYNPKESWVDDLAEKVSQFSADTVFKNLTIATFNYDRTFEEYFCRFLKKSKFFNKKTSSEFQHRNVKHTYGSLGNLDDVPFKLPNDDFNVIKNRHEEIKLIDEKERRTPFLIPDASQYEKVHFIGFGYDRQNMKLLHLGQFTSASFLGTAYMFSNKKIEYLETKYNIKAKNIPCSEYIKSMTF